MPDKTIHHNPRTSFKGAFTIHGIQHKAFQDQKQLALEKQKRLALEKQKQLLALEKQKQLLALEKQKQLQALKKRKQLLALKKQLLALKKQKQLLALEEKINDKFEKRPKVSEYKATSVLIGKFYDKFNQDEGDNPQPLLNNEGKIYDPESMHYCDLGTFNETHGTNLKIEFIKYLIDFMGDNIPVINMKFLKFINEHQDAIETLMRFHSSSIDDLTMGIGEFADTIKDPVQKVYLKVLYEFFGDNISFFDENITYLFKNMDEIISVMDACLNAENKEVMTIAENEEVMKIIDTLNKPVQRLNDAIKTLKEVLTPAVQKVKRAGDDNGHKTSLFMSSANFTMFPEPNPEKQNPEKNTTNGAKGGNYLSASSVSFLNNVLKNTAGFICMGVEALGNVVSSISI